MDACTPEKDVVNQSFTYSISVLEALTTNTKQNKQEPSSNSPQLLKQLSSRVKQSIKDKQHQGAHQHGEDIMILKKSNAELQTVIDQLKSKTSTYKSQYSPYTEVKNNQPLLKSTQRIKDSRIKQDNRRQNKEILDLSPTNASFKKEVMHAINYAIQGYQEKMCRQQKYISELERRLAKLQQIQKKIDILKFQRQVKLQASPKKAKNFSLRTAQVVGDLIEQPQLDYQDREIRFFENPHKKSQSIELSSNDPKSLRQYVLLQEQNAILQQRLDIQIENRTKQAFDRQSLLEAIEQLQKENKNLKKQLNDLQGRLKFNQQKYSDLQIFLQSHKSRISGKILPNIGSTLMNELSCIVNELKICGIDRYRLVQRQINQITIERDHLRKEIAVLQQTIINGCKFSCTHRQVFNLKEKIASLEERNREYLYQLRQSEPYSRINKEQEQINAKAKFQFQKRNEQIDYIKWPRLAYFCMLTSIARLQDIVRQSKSVLKS